MSIRKLFLGVGIMSLLLGVALFAVGKTLGGNSSALATEGVEATAQILKKSITQSASGSDQSSQPVYKVELQIPVSEGGLVSTTVLKEDWEALSEGDSVRVIYWAPHPQTFLIGDRKDAYALLKRSHHAEMLGPGLILFGFLVLGLRFKMAER